MADDFLILGYCLRNSRSKINGNMQLSCIAIVDLMNFNELLFDGSLSLISL